MGPRSARSTAPYQTDAPASTTTWPTSVAVGATQASGCTSGERPSKLNSGMRANLRLRAQITPLTIRASAHHRVHQHRAHVSARDEPADRGRLRIRLAPRRTAAVAFRDQLLHPVQPGLPRPRRAAARGGIAALGGRGVLGPRGGREAGRLEITAELLVGGENVALRALRELVRRPHVDEQPQP